MVKNIQAFFFFFAFVRIRSPLLTESRLISLISYLDVSVRFRFFLFKRKVSFLKNDKLKAL